jgi:hypothetical protein
MIKIKAITGLANGFLITFDIDGETITGKTYFDDEGYDKIDVDGKTYELMGLSYLREV